MTITDTGGADTCAVTRAVTVVVPPPFDWQATGDTVVCRSTVLLEAQSTAATSIIWSDEADFSNILETGNQTLTTTSRPSVYYVQAIDAFGMRAHRQYRRRQLFR